MGPETSLDYNVAHLAVAQAQMSQSVQKVKTTTIFDAIDANFKKAAKRCRESESDLLKQMEKALQTVDNIGEKVKTISGNLELHAATQQQIQKDQAVTLRTLEKV